MRDEKIVVKKETLAQAEKLFKESLTFLKSGHVSKDIKKTNTNSYSGNMKTVN